MINQQLINFLREQLQKGVSREVIYKELLANGWTAQDIEEGFNAINNPSSISTTFNNLPQSKSHSGIKLFLIILVLFLLGTGASAYFFRTELVKLPILKDTFLSKISIMDEAPTEDPSKVDNLSAVISNTDTTPPVIDDKIQQDQSGQVKQNMSDENNKIIDCGTTSMPIKNDTQRKAKLCFDEQFKNCNFAKIIEQSADASLISSKEILGFKEKSCLVKTLVSKSNIKSWENKEMICKFNNSKSLDDINVNGLSKCSGTLFDVWTDKALYSDDIKTVNNSTGKILDPTQFMFISPVQNSKVKIGDTVQLKIIAGKNIEKVRLQSSLQDVYQDVALENGTSIINFEIPETLEPIIFTLDGWTKDGKIITETDREFHGLNTTGIILILKPFTTYKVINISGVPDVIEASSWETSILNDPLYAEFENNATGGLLQVPYSDIDFKIEDQSIIKLIKYGPTYRMKGIKSGETYLDITYMGISKRVPMYFR